MKTKLTLEEERYFYESSFYLYDIPDSLTIEELIEILSKFPKDLKVCTTWESTKHALRPENIYLSRFGVLFIDADDNFYKKDYEND